MRPALKLASAVEGAQGLRRRLALTAAVAGGMDFAWTLSALLGETDWMPEVRLRLGPVPPEPLLPGADLIWSARAACGLADRAGFDGMLADRGIDVPEGPRRRGRQGRVAR